MAARNTLSFEDHGAYRGNGRHAWNGHALATMVGVMPYCPWAGPRARRVELVEMLDNRRADWPEANVAPRHRAGA